MSKDIIKSELEVKDNKIKVITMDNKEFISLTDLARYANPEKPKIPIQTWIRNKDVIAYLGLWEQLNNEDFKSHEFTTFENLARKNSFYMSPQKDRLIKLNNSAIRQMKVLENDKAIKEFENLIATKQKKTIICKVLL